MAESERESMIRAQLFGSDFSLLYTAGATDAGDTLQIRIVESANNTARDLYLDNISLTVIPEPSTAIISAGILVGLGFCRRKRPFPSN